MIKYKAVWCFYIILPFCFEIGIERELSVREARVEKGNCPFLFAESREPYMEQKNILDKIYRLCCRCIYGIGFFLFLLMTLAGIGKTAYVDERFSEVIYVRNDSIIGNLLVFLIFLCILYGMQKWIAKNPEKRLRVLLFIVCGLSFLFSLFWILVAAYYPNADQASVYYIARSFAGGDLSAICPKDSYLSCYPHQLGLIMIYEILMRIFHTEGYRILLCMNPVAISLSVYFGYKIVRMLFPGIVTAVSYLCLMAACLPLFFYGTFLYGEVVSISCILGVTWLLLLICKTPRLRYAAGILGITAIAIMFRKNYLIFVAAGCIVLLLVMIRQWNGGGKDRKKNCIKLAVCLCGMLLVSAAALPCVQRFYEYRAGNRLAEGVPSAAYVAMGMQKSEIGEGWYNGFNYNVYVDNNYDREKVVALSLESIQNSLHEFHANPGRAMEFYRQKFIKQWTNGSFSCFQSTVTTIGGRPAVIESMFLGDLYWYMLIIFERYQFCIYLGALLFTGFVLFQKGGFLKGTRVPKAPSTHKDAEVGKKVRVWEEAEGRKDIGMQEAPPIPKEAEGVESAEAAVLMLTVIGGALFHMIWEANARYVFPYFVCMIPYAAAGIGRFMEKVERIFIYRNM